MSEWSDLWQIGQHFKDGYLHKDEFKIVYVAPMKVKPTHTLLFPLFFLYNLFLGVRVRGISNGD